MGAAMLNKLAHYAIGFVVGALLRRRPTAAVLIAATFGAYQIVERSAKDDDAYPEIREFGIGLGIGLAAEQADFTAMRGVLRRGLGDRRRRWAGLVRKAISASQPASD